MLRGPASVDLLRMNRLLRRLAIRPFFSLRWAQEGSRDARIPKVGGGLAPGQLRAGGVPPDSGAVPPHPCAPHYNIMGPLFFRLRFPSWLGALLALAAGVGSMGPAAAEEATAGGLNFFENKVRPVLVEHCYKCHSAEAKKIGGDLTLDTREGFRKGGIDGPVAVAGAPDASLLIQAIRGDDPHLQMPPPKGGGRKLSAAEIADLTQWVHLGAPYPETPPAKKAAAKRPWSLAPVRPAAPPPVRDAAWPTSPIDPFILAKLEAGGLHPAPPADKPTLIRRATFDLTGLPPTPEEVAAFVGDTSPAAFAAVVDRLLASPRHGEHWGRHWLDVVRYADTAGDTADYPLPEAWRYRNYVIDSFNTDKPYDQFIREQIAGDIMAQQGPPERYAEQVTATGFLALSRRFGFDSENYHHLTIQDTIDTLGQSVLGLTLGCARCHDHKFDPVTVQDYYGLFGIFESTKYAFPGSEQKQRQRSAVPLVPWEASRGAWEKMQAGFAALGLAPAAVLRSLDDMDGDFEMQKPASGGSNGVLVPPWFYRGKVAVTGAQSPFRHLYPFGNVAASLPGGAEPYAVWQTFHPARRSGIVQVNVEFRAARDPAAPGRHRLTLGAQGQPPALEAFISAAALSFSEGGEAREIPLPQPGEWHCLQLVLDLGARTFAGSVGTPGQVTRFAPRPMGDQAGGAIDSVALDSTGSGDAPRPPLDIDNLAVPSAPLPAVSLTSAGPGPDAPSLEALRAAWQELAGLDGDLEGQVNGSAPSANWHPGPQSAAQISTAAQSPFQNIYPSGTLGIHLPATADGAYNGYGNRLPQAYGAEGAPILHVSFDFRCGADPTALGTWRFHLGHTAATPAVQLECRGADLFCGRGDAPVRAAPLQAGQWHQVQLALDLKAKTFTGTVTTPERQTALAGKLASGWDGIIDYLFLDSGGHLRGAKPEIDADNFQISTEPFAPLAAPAIQWAGDSRSALHRARRAALRQQIDQRQALAEQARKDLDAQLAVGPVAMAYGVSEGTPHSARIQLRGEPDKPGSESPRSFIRALGQADLPATAVGSGRRELADWITRSDNPLTARVMVNRLWQYHFGRGLVATGNDFGTRSEPPAHPELLDFLAAQLVQSGWSLKAMHRLILLSATWQQASHPAAAGDPRVEALWGSFPRRRLGAEEIRDSILAVSGTLDLAPGREHPFPPATSWGFTQHGPFAAVYDHDKRSVYLMVQRIKRHPFLSLFDGADPNASTAARRITTVPTQALYFLNDPFVHAKARQFAQRLAAFSSAEPQQIELATQLAFGRAPTPEELAEAAAFLAAYRAELGASGESSEALAAYGRTLFGSNEFLHCD